MLYWYGFKLGVQSLINGRFSRETIKNIIAPVNYWRNIEYRIVLNELKIRNGDVILDIGSPKLLSLYLAEKFDVDVFTIDIKSYFVNDYISFQAIRGIATKKFNPAVMDGRSLDFPDNSFNKVYSISVLEHIPQHGDTQCVKEITRVLKKGGISVITVPYADKGTNEFRRSDSFYWSDASQSLGDTDETFFQRRYSEKELFERLINPSGLKLLKVLYVGEKIFIHSKNEISSYLKPITGPIQPLISYIAHTKPTIAPHLLKKPLAAVLILEK